MLYTKGERRYTEASDAEILAAASRILYAAGLSELSIRIGGMAEWVKGGDSLLHKINEAVRSRARAISLPNAEPIKPPRRGVEPA